MLPFFLNLVKIIGAIFTAFFVGKFSCADFSLMLVGLFIFFFAFLCWEYKYLFLKDAMARGFRKIRYSDGPVGPDKYRNVHPFHLVDPSVLPFLTSFASLGVVLAGVLYMHKETYPTVPSFFLFILSIILLVSLMFVWWSNVIYESYRGYHTVRVKKGLKIGFILFIVSEVMFFLGFFWAFFHSSLSPAIQLGSIWPPLGIETFDPTTFPLLNTLILLLSGVSITCAHYYMMSRDVWNVWRAFRVTLALALMFTYVQFDEFYNAPFSISDGVYGSCFFMITGLHGFHVIIGTLFIFFCYLRYKPVARLRIVDLMEENVFFTKRTFLGFEFASWYWHFVDVVWLYVYTFLYWWGSL